MTHSGSTRGIFRLHVGQVARTCSRLHTSNPGWYPCAIRQAKAALGIPFASRMFSSVACCNHVLDFAPDRNLRANFRMSEVWVVFCFLIKIYPFYRS